MSKTTRIAASGLVRMEGLIEPLIPAGVSWAVTRCGARGNVASEREMAIVSRAVPKRRAEFAAGRSAARAALARFGFGGAELLAGKHREPLWPDRIVGSITHAAGVAAAAVADETAIEALGIDLEAVDRDAPPDELIICPAERPGLGGLGEELGKGAFFVYFSAKEAVFKAMYPRHRRYFDFLDVTLEPDGPRSFRCLPGRDAPGDPQWGRLRVYWTSNANFVFSTAYLPGETVDGGGPKPG